MGLHSQTDSLPEKPDQAVLDSIYREYYQDSADSVREVRDTFVPHKFIGYDYKVYKISKANLRKTLLDSKSPAVRGNLDNWIVFVWGIVVLILLVLFKSLYPLQYRLLSKAWYSNIVFNEFLGTQTSVFKNSKLLTWLIISQSVSIGVYIAVQASDNRINLPEPALIGLISMGVGLIFAANQWLKSVFAYSFYQPGLSHDYAIIFRIQAYISSLFLLPILLFVYYRGFYNMEIVITVVLITYLLLVYGFSLVKFVLSGRILQNQSNFILFLYLCAFEILPLIVLVKSITNLLEYD